MSTSSILSQTLQAITKTKVKELAKQQSSFASRKQKILANVVGSDRERIQVLLTGLASLHGLSTESEPDSKEFDDALGGSLKTRNIYHFLRQSQHDPSIPPTLLPKIERDLRQILNQRTERFAYANLYSRLLTEWLRADDSGNAPAGIGMETASDEGSEEGSETFEIVEKQKERLKQLSEKFESVVFSPLDVDANAVKKLMEGLFVGEEAETALASLRSRIRNFGRNLAQNKAPFDCSSLSWCIDGLLKSDLLSDQKKNTLEAFRQDSVVQGEIADVLNMRFLDLERWEWDAEEGIPVEPRRQLNGKYRVVMDEEILQSIFVHYISTMWAVEFKSALLELLENPQVWRKSEHMPPEVQEKHEYYLGVGFSGANGGVTQLRETEFRKRFFMCQLPTTVEQSTDYEEDETGETSKLKFPATGVKQTLLRTLGADVLLNRALKGEVAMVQSDIQWFATSTSHRTVDVLVKFFGVPKIWRDFFQRYLRAPLKMVGLDGQSGDVKTRQRGVPIGHVFQKLFGELIIFSMDLAVNQQAGMYLYRLHDDLWLCGSPQQCAKAWTTMQRCASVMGVEFNEAKTGSVYMTEPGVERVAEIDATLPKGKVVCGFLKLEESGDWVIDHEQVKAHAQQLSKQLAECSSVFAWVQTWNSCIGRFFNYTFGQPANCFGRNHIDMILETHNRIQTNLFRNGKPKSSSVTEYLKTLISERFEVENVPDAFLYFPEEVGGLGLRNPFITFLVVREQVLENPRARLEQFFEDEKRNYKQAKDVFDKLSEREKRERLETIIGKDPGATSSTTRSTEGGENKAQASWKGPKDDEFFSMEEYTKYRISSSLELMWTYYKLLGQPVVQDVEPSPTVYPHLKKLNDAGEWVGWSDLTSEHKWMLELYGGEVIERFGGLSIVDKTLLPMGVMNLLRSRKVVWQTVL